MNNNDIIFFIIFVLIISFTIYICRKINFSKRQSEANSSVAMGSIKQPNGRFMNVQQSPQRATKQQGVFPQSLSGSETDVSTSNENLSHEERYVIRHTARVEPQGQETLQNPSPSPTQSPVINRLKSPNQNVSRKLESNIPRPFDMNRKMDSNLPVRIKHESNMSKIKDTSIPRIIDNSQNPRNSKESTNSLNRKDLQNRNSMENRNSISEIGGNICSNRNSLKTDSLSNRNSLKDSLGSNRSSLDVSSSSYNTLIIHNQDESWNARLAGHHPAESPPYNKMNNPKVVYAHSSEHPTMPLRHNYETRNYDEQGMQEITDIPDDYLNQSHVLKHLAKEVKTPSMNSRSNSHTRDSGLSENSDSLRSRKLSDDQFTDCGDRGDLMEERVRMDSGFGMEKTMNSEYGDSTQPPEYPKWIEESPTTSNFQLTNPIDKGNLSRSQPELSKLSDKNDFDDNLESRPKTKGCEMESCDAETFEALLNENAQLKSELSSCYQKVSKSQKLEQEVLNIHQAHEELVQSCDRRERLERAARNRLQGDCRRLNELNRALRDQVELLTAQLLAPSDSSSMQTQPLRNEINQREILIAQLITQNKELVAAKERQEIELAAQRATLQEQRTHIDILDTALTNAQGNVVRLEEECRKKQMYVDRVAQLQRALSSLQLASDRREQTERKLRSQLESELRKDGATAAGEHELKRQVRERDEKIMRLEAECLKWEQRYLEESALRQSAIDAASIPKDAKIAALEKTSQETEKIIAEARSENIKQMDQVHAAQKRVHDLETRTKDLESKLAERDAMIRVLQKHVQTGPNLVPHLNSYEQDKASNYLSPHHTPHASLHNDEIVSSVLTHSSNYGSTNSYSSDSYRVPSPYHHQNLGYSTFDASRRSLDDQLKELDNQLLSKRGLCCFPGFSNSSTTPRKGKISKPLLPVRGAHGSVSDSGRYGSTTLVSAYEAARYDTDRPEEIMLLEKQGRSSQQQRMAPDETSSENSMENGERSRSGSLPPSSLPRPPRISRQQQNTPPRRTGEYGRFGDKEQLHQQQQQHRQQRSLVSPPRRCLYGRLPDTATTPPPPEQPRLRRGLQRFCVGGNGGSAEPYRCKTPRDSGSTISDHSASSLPPSSSRSASIKQSLPRRSGSLTRDPGDSPKFRLQF